MNSGKLHRRRVLHLGGTAAIVAVAGCIGDDTADDADGTADDADGTADDGDGTADDADDPSLLTPGEVPAYAETVPAVDDEVFVLYLDIAALEELDDELEDDEPSDVDDEFEDIEDPVLLLPFTSLIGVVFLVGFAFMGTGLERVLDDEGQDQLATTITELYLANDAIVLGGAIDTDEIGDILTDVPEGNVFAVEFEAVDEAGGFVIYEPADETQQEQVLAVGDDHILLGDARAQLDPFVETVAGERNSAVEEYEPFEWLLSVASGHVTFGGYSPDGFEESEDFDEDDDELEEFLDATGLASSLTFGDRTMDATLAVTFDDLTDEIRTDIEALIEEETGTLAEEYSLEVHGDRIIVSATYDEDELDGV